MCAESSYHGLLTHEAQSARRLAPSAVIVVVPGGRGQT